MNDGDVELFLSLVERHRRYLYNLALRMTGNEQDAKDVVQDTLLNAYLRLEQFEGRADLRTWLNRILVNCALDHLRVGVYARLAALAYLAEASVRRLSYA